MESAMYPMCFLAGLIAYRYAGERAALLLAVGALILTVTLQIASLVGR